MSSSFTPNVSLISPKMRKIIKRFETAKSIDELLKAFKDMESCFEEKDLGRACLYVGQKLKEANEDHEKVLSFCSRALSIMIANDRSSFTSLSVVGVLNNLGSTCLKLDRFDESLSYLNWADRMLTKLEGDDISDFDNIVMRTSSAEGKGDGDDTCYSDNIVLRVSLQIQLELCKVKNAMRKREEGVVHLRKVCEIVEKISGKDSEELAKATRETSDSYMAVLNLKEALHFCLKSFKICRKVFGDNSEEVAECRKQLALIYCRLGEHEKSLEHSQLSQRLYKNLGCTSLLVRTEIEYAHTLKELGRYEEAVKTMKNAIPRVEQQSEDHITLLTFLANILCCQNKYSEAKKYAKMVCRILDKKESSSTDGTVAELFGQIAHVCQEMGELETALSLLKRAAIIVKNLPVRLSHPYLENISERIGALLMLTGKLEEAVPYFEDVVEKRKESYGSKHCDVGYAYSNLASNFLGINKPHSSAEAFACAKDIFDESLGPLHPTTIKTCKNLSRAYTSMGSYSLALETLEMTVIRTMEAHGPDLEKELAEAASSREKIMAKAAATEISESLSKDLKIIHKDDEEAVVVSGKDSQSCCASETEM